MDDSSRFGLYVIEICGPAGAGKSTLVPKLAATLNSLGIQTSDSTIRFSAGSYLARLPEVLRAVVAVASCYFQTPFSGIPPGITMKLQRFRCYLFWTRSMNLARRVIAARRLEHGVCVIENGEAYFRTDTELRGCPGLDAVVPKTRVLIYLEVSEDLMLERLQSRGLSKGPESRALAESKIFRTMYMAGIANVFQEMEKQVPSLKVKGSLPTEEQVTEIVEFVLSASE